MSAEKVYLKVDFAHNKLAKELGAKFDGEKKKWYYWKNDDPEIDELHGNKLRFIADWIPPIIETEYKHVEKPEPLHYFTGEEILEFLGFKRGQITFAEYGFCGMCDSNISDEWVCGNVHFEHCGDGVWHKWQTLNQTERSILYHYLEITETSSAYLKYKKAHNK